MHHTPLPEDKYTMTPSETFKDVYSRVTERVIADLEKGVRTWMKPWNYAAA
jgi:antirestriction protein ArdC